MTQRFERRLPNTSYGVHDAKASAEAGGMTLEELERCFLQALRLWSLCWRGILHGVYGKPGQRVGSGSHAKVGQRTEKRGYRTGSPRPRPYPG